MQLTKVIQTGELLYFSRQPEPILVSENQDYRWLMLSNTLQSLMLKRRPYQLTLPHQTALMLPLLFFRPLTLVEFGLGGGNLGRFLLHLQPELQFTSIEQNPNIVSVFEQFFNPQHADIKVINTCLETWLLDQPNTNHKQDWLIYDIYQRRSLQGDHLLPQVLHNLVDKMSEHTCLSINLPSYSKAELNLLLTKLQQSLPGREIVFFDIALYKNVIIHIMPTKWQIGGPLMSNNYLIPRVSRRWLQFWQRGKRFG
jgi:spermidine synthase